uniref:Uncharacterized protein n=1 Tax=Arundo donax TaxID=35708 RepID=A0A0A9FQ34_ARUDO
MSCHINLAETAPMLWLQIMYIRGIDLI